MGVDVGFGGGGAHEGHVVERREEDAAVEGVEVEEALEFEIGQGGGFAAGPFFHPVHGDAAEEGGLGALVESGGAGMVGDEAGGFGFMEGVEFLAIDGGHGGLGGEKIIGMERMGKAGWHAGTRNSYIYHFTITERVITMHHPSLGITPQPSLEENHEQK